MIKTNKFFIRKMGVYTYVRLNLVLFTLLLKFVLTVLLTLSVIPVLQIMNKYNSLYQLQKYKNRAGSPRKQPGLTFHKLVDNSGLGMIFNCSIFAAGFIHNSFTR